MIICQKKKDILSIRSLHAPYFDAMIGRFDNHKKQIDGKLLNVSNTQITMLIVILRTTLLLISMLVTLEKYYVELFAL